MPYDPLYDADFYRKLKANAYRSALVVIPVLQRLVPFKTVCDVGCGAGSWLQAFAEHGITDYLGLDGDYVDRASLAISAEQFHATDLSRPFILERKFDLAVSLEVAEHLPRSRAESFVADLTKVAPLVLFSAAIPHQGGTGHVNEQWQPYWVELFGRHGFQVFDVMRPAIWNSEEVMRFYRQNIFVFCRKDHIANCPALLAAQPSTMPLAIVHPAQYILRVEEPGLRELLRAIWRSGANAISRRLPGGQSHKVSWRVKGGKC